MKNLVVKHFSQIKNLEKNISPKFTKEKRIRQKLLDYNQYYDNYNSKNFEFLKKSKKETDRFFPKQHPYKLDSSNSDIISFKPYPRPLTKLNHVPAYIQVFEPPEFDPPHDSKALDVGILGAANSGKSTLLNKIIGKEISPNSSKSHTTDQLIEGVYTDVEDRTQIVFTDTMGAVKASWRYSSKGILTKSWSTLIDNDKVIFLIDGVKRIDFVLKEAIKRLFKRTLSPKEVKMLNYIKSARKNEGINISEIQHYMNQESVIEDYEQQHLSSILVINKCDLITNRRKLRSIQSEIEDIGIFDKVFHISATTGFGVDNLVEYLKTECMRRPWRYHPAVTSTLSEKERCENLVQQEIFNRLHKEFPFETAVTMISWVPHINGSLEIHFQIECKSEVNVKMLIGAKGRVISELKKESEKNLKIFYQKPVKIKFFISTRRGGRIDYLNETDFKSI